MGSQPKRGRPRKQETAAPVVQNTNDYHVYLTCGDTTYEGHAASIIDAFQSLPQPTHTAQNGKIKVTHGEKVIEKVVFVSQMRRLFRYRLQRALWARRFSVGL